MLHPPLGIHGFTKTYERVKRSFFWDGMKQEVHAPLWLNVMFFNATREKQSKPLGHSNPFQFPLLFGRDISMDFIVGLPKSNNKTKIMVVDDHLSKYAHLCAL
jgi:hypothetical protein